MTTLNPAAGSMYARLWRWHFFAALLVVPFVLWQAVTGTLYLWAREITVASRPDLLTVTPGAERVAYQAQLDAALAVHPRPSPPELRIDPDATRSTIFLFTAPNGLSWPTFVDPYTGKVLGTLSPARWLGGWSRSLHGGWPLGRWGSHVLEIGAGWAIVMILTGLYLWWPRNSPGVAGVLFPRLGQGSRVFWRDLHCTVGAWFSLVVMAFLFTALPWTAFWGETLLAAVQSRTGQYTPAATFFGGGHGHAGQGAAAVAAPLDRFIEGARAAGASGRLEVRLSGSGNVQVRSQTGRSPLDLYLEFDRTTAALVRREGWRDTTWVPRVVSLGVDLHQGTYFGRVNQLFNTLVAGSLVWLAVTGFIGWLKRRPGKGFSAPPPSRHRLGSGIKVAGALMCVAMPLFGLSVVAVALTDLLLRRLKPDRG